MNATEYKKYHESFMENNHGSTLLHTFICIFYTVQCSIKISIEQRYKTDFIQYVYEYLFIVLPMILVHTVLSGYIEILTAIDSLILLYKLSKVVTKSKISKTLKGNNSFRTQRIQLISWLRGLTYLITVFCILAVDFKEFPRYLAKTEKFGYSLMDTGVGLFILMSGLVHKDFTKDNYKSVLKANLKFITILVVLGIARFVSVKQLDYQEHVTEYGVHWNFFFTLAVCKLVTFILLQLFTHPLLLSICTLVLHEFLLRTCLQKWVFSDTPRISFVDANREGISSSLGYVSMYLFAAYLKKELSDQSIQRGKLLTKLICGSILLCCLSYFVNLLRPTSRTLANSSYCLYIVTILMIISTLMYFLEAVTQDKENKFCYEIPLTLSAINKNGLLYFLVSNLLTGLLNMSMQTLLIPPFTTFIILNMYMIFTLTLAVYLNKYGLSM